MLFYFYFCLVNFSVASQIFLLLSIGAVLAIFEIEAGAIKVNLSSYLVHSPKAIELLERHQLLHGGISSSD